MAWGSWKGMFMPRSSLQEEAVTGAGKLYSRTLFSCSLFQCAGCDVTSA